MKRKAMKSTTSPRNPIGFVPKMNLTSRPTATGSVLVIPPSYATHDSDQKILVVHRRFLLGLTSRVSLLFLTFSAASRSPNAAPTLAHVVLSLLQATRQATPASARLPSISNLRHGARRHTVATIGLRYHLKWQGENKRSCGPFQRSVLERWAAAHPWKMNCTRIE